MSFKVCGNKTEKLTKIPKDTDRHNEEQVPKDSRCIYIYICDTSHMTIYTYIYIYVLET